MDTNNEVKIDIEEKEYKIVWLVSPPRSRSTGVLRYMQGRGDFQIMNEPFQLAYNKLHSPESVWKWYREDAPQTYEEAIDRIFEAAKHGNVFVKDMSFTFADLLSYSQDVDNNDNKILNCDESHKLREKFDLPFRYEKIEETSELLRKVLANKNVYIVMLLRNPHHSIISCYKRLSEEQFEEIKDQAYNFFGYSAAYDVYSKVWNFATNSIHTIISEQLCTDGEAEMKKLCDHVGIPFRLEHMRWEDLDLRFDGVKEWNEIKPKEVTVHWHYEAMVSRCYISAKMYLVDSDGSPTFREIRNPDHASFVSDLYLSQRFYYTEILKWINTEYHSRKNYEEQFYN